MLPSHRARTVSYTHLDVYKRQAANDVHNYQLATNVPDGLPLTGIWKPDGRTADPAAVLDTDAPATSLSSFTNADGSGEWTLFLANLESGATNVLLGWELNLTSSNRECK